MMLGPLTAVEPGMGEPLLILSLVVIIIGGIGSVRGAFIAAILIGIVDTMGRVLLPVILRSFMGQAAGRGWAGAGLDDGLYPDVARAGDPADRPVPAEGIGRWVWFPFLGRADAESPAGADLAGFALFPVLSGIMDEPFWNDLAMRIMLLGMAAMGLNLVLGYGGMVSFGHAAFVGIGATASASASFTASTTAGHMSP